MNLISNVFDLAEEFMVSPQYVDILEDNVYTLAEHMGATGIKPFPPQSTGENHRVIILKELTASSINYCYWYGKSDIRPGGCGSGLMYDLVNQALEKYGYYTLKGNISELKRELALHRFPLLEERMAHLTEVAIMGEQYATMMMDNLPDPGEGYYYPMFKALVEKFPGFASDLFLKRASLFFLQLYRKMGWYKEAMDFLPVPADYQVPKMLKHFKCLRYSDSLKTMIEMNVNIPKGSLEETEIRAGTIVVCQMLQKATGWNISDIDSWLWLRRKECNDPFHLTITTDY